MVNNNNRKLIDRSIEISYNNAWRDCEEKNVFHYINKNTYENPNTGKFPVR